MTYLTSWINAQSPGQKATVGSNCSNGTCAPMWLIRQFPDLCFVLECAASLGSSQQVLPRYTVVSLLLRVHVREGGRMGEREGRREGGLRRGREGWRLCWVILQYLTYDTPETLRLREEQWTNGIFCMGQLYKQALLFGQFCVYCDAWSVINCLFLQNYVSRSCIFLPKALYAPGWSLLCNCCVFWKSSLTPRRLCDQGMYATWPPDRQQEHPVYLVLPFPRRELSYHDLI